MQPIQIEIVQLTSNLVKIKLTESDRVIQVPRRVFNRRMQVGTYEVKDPSSISSVI